MNRRQLAWLAGILLGVGLCGCGKSESGPETKDVEAKVDALTRKVDELRTLLAEVRQSKPDADTRLREWAERNLVPGRTTLGEVRALFGVQYTDLDRPGRDEVLTIQYSLDEVAGKKLVLDFARASPVAHLDAGGDDFCFSAADLFRHPLYESTLQNFEGALFFCGFCPHVLVDDGRWRLEGKMLPGAVGRSHEGSDTLVLPRARVRQGKVRLRLANWAPEVEYLDRAQLGVMAGRGAEQLDLDLRGEPYVWHNPKPLGVGVPEVSTGSDHWRLALGPAGKDAVLVLELRNTERFQNLTRRALRFGAALPDAGLAVRFDQGGCVVPAVGTKFLRRVVVPLPAGTAEVNMVSPAGLWWLRRAWLGQGRRAEEVRWLSPAEGKGPDAAAELLRQRDGKRLCLRRDEEAELSFRVSPEAGPGQRLLFLLRLWGYYEGTPDISGPEKGP